MIYTEDKAKVVAAFCHASYFPPEWFEEKGEFILFLQIILVQFNLFFVSSYA